MARGVNSLAALKAKQAAQEAAAERALYVEQPPPEPEPPTPQPQPQQTPPLKIKDDIAELSLLVRLQDGSHRRWKEGTFAGDEAVDAVLAALEVAARRTNILEERPPPVPVKRICRFLFALIVLILVTGLLMAMTRVAYREFTVEDGVLLASGTPSFGGEELVAALGVAYERKGLGSCTTLDPSDLSRTRDIELVHRGNWYNIRISRVQKFSDNHVWFQGLDGSGVRVRSNRVFLRIGSLGDEEAVSPSDAAEAFAAAYLEFEVETDAA
mmetsp:Transcript_50323/g.126755  ORF Transcript_50323/g.126755 Transcript_50323/m.126755 type:complete len:269 (-) Transcript_50323:71-877(-)|eukprot:CAMPEP_0115305976 /NCGR_PEP_ID=MMETSP0270-20121206/72323_1 /TAXON_ID=71861 /ORGANISM="Scrippsiella trochoidea, Strain CCMP3099" /LENGTH=268 /DNA_ID=CAMNT_0002724245 /DNA_START=27 /DNA_END=833 /DNA_ORIENTATION=+